MTQFDNTNTGMLARNKNKDSDKHPDFKGSINVNGEEFWLAGWIREGKEGGKMEGQKFFSLKVEPKEQAKQAPKNNAKRRQDDDDNSIPF